MYKNIHNVMGGLFEHSLKGQGDKMWRDEPVITAQYTHGYPNNVEKYISTMNDVTIGRGSGMVKKQVVDLLHNNLDKCSCPKKRMYNGKILINHNC